MIVVSEVALSEVAGELLLVLQMGLLKARRAHLRFGLIRSGLQTITYQ